MRAPSLALAVLAILALPAWAIELVELKDGRVLEAEQVSVRGEKLVVRLHVPAGDRVVAYAIPFEKVVPEFIYYAWAAGLAEGDADGLHKLAGWSRGNGLFSLAWKAYEKAAKHQPQFEATLPELARELHTEEATWLFEEGWRHFRDGDVARARARAERILEHFADTAEVGRAQELLSIVQEREQFLSEQKKQAEIAQRARRHRREMERHLDLIAKADSQVLKARFQFPGDAERRLTWAAYTYRKAALVFADLHPAVEVDDLRLALEAWQAELSRRLVRTFLKLGDLRFLNGDPHGALDAAHEVLALEPANKEANDLRGRVLDVGPEPRERRVEVVTSYPYGYAYWRRMRPPYVDLYRGFGVIIPKQSSIRIARRYVVPYGVYDPYAGVR